MEMIFSLVIFLVLAYILYLIIQWLPLPPPVKQIVVILFALFVLIGVVGIMFGIGPGTGIHFKTFIPRVLGVLS